MVRTRRSLSCTVRALFIWYRDSTPTAQNWHGPIDLAILNAGTYAPVRAAEFTSAAARQMGMSYRRAWFLLDSMQSGFRDPLFVTERGGSSKGGATLTPLGKDLIRRYRAHIALVDDQSADILSWMRAVQIGQNDD